MQELIDKLNAEHGLSSEQSHGILATITNFIKDKFPMAEGMINNIFPQQASVHTISTDPTVAGDASTSDTTVNKGGSFLDKISDFIPGETGQKVEDFAKDKLGGFFGGNKKDN